MCLIQAVRISVLLASIVHSGPVGTVDAVTVVQHLHPKSSLFYSLFVLFVVIISLRLL